MKTGIELIAIERAEQIEKHGRTPELDVNLNNHYQLSEAAGLLVWVDPEGVGGEAWVDDTYYFPNCPAEWDEQVWDKMMNKSYKERLVIAGALIAAEIDRLQYQPEGCVTLPKEGGEDES